MTRVLILVNSTGSKPGLLVPWLLGRDVEFDVRIGAVSGSPTPDDLDEYDGLVLLGGGYMPDDVARGPWLAGEAELTRAALARETPLLGICLGGQMLAHVGGGTVAANTGAPEKGSTRIRLTADAENGIHAIHWGDAHLEPDRTFTWPYREQLPVAPAQME